MLRQLLHHYLPTSPYGPPFRTVPCSVSPTAPPPAVRPPIVAGRAVRGEPGAEPGCLVMIPYEPGTPTAPRPPPHPTMPATRGCHQRGEGGGTEPPPVASPRHLVHSLWTTAPRRRYAPPGPAHHRSAQRTAPPGCPHGPGEGKATAPPQGAGNPPDNSPHATPAPLPNKRPSAIRGPYPGAVRGPLYPLTKAISLGPTPFAVDRIALCSAVGKLTA